jgi:hypothetical protein
MTDWLTDARPEVLTAINIHVVVFWVMTPCGIVVEFQRYREQHCLNMAAAARYCHIITRCHNSEDHDTNLTDWFVFWKHLDHRHKLWSQKPWTVFSAYWIHFPLKISLLCNSFSSMSIWYTSFRYIVDSQNKGPWRWAADWMIRSSSPGGGWDLFSSPPCQGLLWVLPSLLFNGYQGFFRWE